MKRVLSWLVLIIGMVLSTFILNILVEIVVFIGVKVYNFSSILFWIIILLGGSFGLTIAYVYSSFAASYLYKISERIKPSQKGVRYVVASLLVGIPFVLDIIRQFITNRNWIDLAGNVLWDICVAIMCVLIFIVGVSYES